nr:type II secretion system F family protein [bacterium]
MVDQPAHLVAALFTSFTLMGAMLRFFPLPKRLSARVRPYAGTGGLPGMASDPGAPFGRTAGSAPVRLFGPMILSAAHGVGRIADRMGEGQLILRLRQARFYAGLEDRDRVASYRLAVLGTAATVAGMGAGIMVALRQPTLVVLAAAIGGGFVGSLRVRGRLDRAVEQRRSMMKIEISTINQLLAIRVRSGSGVMHAVGETTARGRGEVIGELGTALRMHRSGMSAAQAFRRMAEITPESYCARTYKLLASSDEMGVDLAAGLRVLADDARRARREELRRSAVKRRSAMLIPTIAILAPVMLLFVAAPLPQLVLGWT